LSILFLYLVQWLCDVEVIILSNPPESSLNIETNNLKDDKGFYNDKLISALRVGLREGDASKVSKIGGSESLFICC
jgi:hypothetical protein